MKMSFAQSLLIACGLGLLAGCVKQVPVKHDFQVSQTLPEEMALDYLMELEHGYNGRSLPYENPVCQYSERGIAGSKITHVPLVGSYSNRAGELPFRRWRVSEIRAFSVYGSDAVTLIVKDDTGAICAPLREWGDHDQQTTYKTVEKALAALVSLGVRYDPSRLGRKGW